MRVRGDRHQWLVELVSDACRHLAHGGQACHLGHAVLRQYRVLLATHPIGHIHARAQPARRRAIGGAACDATPVNRARLTVGDDRVELPLVRAAARECALEQQARAFAFPVAAHVVEPFAAKNFLRRSAQQLCPREFTSRTRRSESSASRIES